MTTADAMGTAGAARRLLGIYLNDHLMGSAGGIELARRCLRSNRGTPLGDFLTHLVDEIREDREVLEQLMTALGVPADRIKLLAANAGEKVSRLKLNGRLLGYSDLSRVIELEGLCAGVFVKQRLWTSLRRLRDADADAVPAADVDRMVERAAEQLEQLEQHRLEAVARAFGATSAIM